MIISIVGKSGSGKSFITELLCSYSSKIVKLNIDKVRHYCLTLDEVKEELIKSFSKDIITDYSIDRKKLGDLVFNNQEKMQKLTDITWYHMEEEIDKFIRNNNNKIIILDWLLLPKTKYFNENDIKILVDAPFDIRMKRAMKRDSITKEAFEIRDNASMEFNKSDFDYVLENIDINKTKRKVRDIYGKSIISR